MTAEVSRLVMTKLAELDMAVYDLSMENLQLLSSKLEESRRTTETAVKAATAQLGAELRAWDAAHEKSHWRLWQRVKMGQRKRLRRSFT